MSSLNNLLARGLNAPLMGEAFKQGRLQKMAVDMEKEKHDQMIQINEQKQAQAKQAEAQAQAKQKALMRLAPDFLSEDPETRQRAILQATLIDPQAGKAISGIVTNPETSSLLQEVLLSAGLNPYDSSPFFDPAMSEQLGERYMTLQADSGDSPSAVREFEFWRSLSEEEQEDYLAVKRMSPEEAGERTAASEKAKTEAIPERAVVEEAADDMQGARKRINAAKASIARSDSVLEEISFAMERAKAPGATGAVGQATMGVKASPAGRLAQVIDTIKANLSFDRIAEMRKNSPTGGALGQVSERELKLLGDSVAALDPGMPEEDLLRALEKVQRHYQNWIDVQNEAIRRDQGLLNIDAEEEKPVSEMTDEELEEALRNAG